jgi:hypothetical protein
MTAQETKLLNAFETTISGAMSSTALTITVNAVSNAAGDTLTAPCYLVVEPDSATQREYFLVSSIDTGTKTLTISAIGNRYLRGSAATSGLTHAAGSTLRVSAMAQHFEDLNDRIDANFNEAGTQIVAGNAVKDEDNMASDSAVHLATQQSIKAYVDSQVTAQDLDFAGDTGTGAVDLDSQSFTIAGTANEIETSASAQTITIGLPSTITTTLSGTSVLSDGVTATTQAASDNSTKVATTAYVDAQVTAEDLDITTDSGTIAIDLDSEILTVAGGTGIDTSAATNTVTIAIDSTVATLTGTQTLTNKTISGSSNTLSNIANASLTNSSITVSDSETVPNTSAIDLGGTLTFAGTANEVTVLESAGTVTISLPATINADTTGNAATATTAGALSSAVTVSLTGDIVGSGTFTSAGDTATISTTIQANSVALGTDTTGNYVEDVTAGAGLSKTSVAGEGQTVDLALDANDLAVATAVSTDYVVIEDVTDNSTKKALISDIISQGDITGVTITTSATSGLSGGDSATSGDFSASLVVDPSQLADGSGITVDTSNDLLILEDVTDGTVYKVKPSQIASGSANALTDGDSDLTITDGINNGLDYNLDSTDMATWNTGGIALTTNGGIFRHHQTQAATYTVATNEGAVLAGPITITGTVTNNGTMVVI